MKIFIAADMEGITGVTNWDQVNPSHSEYPRFRKLMTADVNAAIQGAFESGADEVVVKDGHANGTNILIEELAPSARLNASNSSPFAMVQGIDESFDGVFFVGYHARAGTKKAILDHTWSSSSVANVWLNDQPVGEVGLNAAVCGHYGVPVIMVSGDQTVCAEAMDLLGQIEVAVVKQAVGRMAAECLPPQLAQEKICEAAARAVSRLKAGQTAPFRVQPPVTVVVEFFNSSMADSAARLPWSKRLDGRRIQVTLDDMPSAYQAFQVLVSLARS